MTKAIRHFLVTVATVFPIIFIVLMAPPAPASALVSAQRSSSTPVSEANTQPSRYGIVPTRTWLKNHATQASATNLTYNGDLSDPSVTTGPPKIYLVFWGSQWGSQSTNAQGNVTLSGDPNAIAPLLQGFFKGLGTGGETWSGVMTQYCQGIATGAQSCPSNTQHVGYPLGGSFAGLWVDESSAAPAEATWDQIAQEAVNAAAHFGNTTPDANRNAQYDVISPTGTNPDNYRNSGLCAWHSYTNDAPGGPMAFTNMPYLTDVGRNCGANFVNSGAAGTDDGVTIINGHEYAETITDQFPASGWIDSSGNESADKCAWLSLGQGSTENLTLTTGTFAVQSIWANDFDNGTGGCEVSHPITSTGSSSYEAESPSNTLSGGAAVITCAECSDGARVGYVGSGGVLTFNNIVETTAGTYPVVIAYTQGQASTLTADISVNGAPATAIQFPKTASFNVPANVTMSLPLAAGSNTIGFSNPTKNAPDIDDLTLPSGSTTNYEAESSANILAGGAKVIACATCSGGDRVGDIGVGATLEYKAITVPTTGIYQVAIAYTQNQGSTLTAYISINSGTATKVLFDRTASWTATEDLTMPMMLTAGPNTIEFSNPTKNAPDIDAIIVP